MPTQTNHHQLTQHPPRLLPSRGHFLSGGCQWCLVLLAIGFRSSKSHHAPPRWPVTSWHYPANSTFAGGITPRAQPAVNMRTQLRKWSVRVPIGRQQALGTWARGNGADRLCLHSHTVHSPHQVYGFYLMDESLSRPAIHSHLTPPTSIRSNWIHHANIPGTKPD